MPATPQLPGVRQLIETARAWPARTLPSETRQSYPIAVPDPRGLRIAFLYGKQWAEPGAIHLLAPGYIAFLRAQTGKFQEIKSVTPAALGQPHAPDQYLGPHTLPEGMTLEDSLREQDRLYQLYDLLLPAFATGQTNVAPEVKKAAAEFRTLFPKLAENVFLPYYHAVGKEFFGWVNRIAATAP